MNQRLVSGIAAVVLSAAALISVSSAPPAGATTTVPLAGPNPILIDQTSTTDNLQVLLATLAERQSDMSVAGATEGRKNFYIRSFLTSADYLQWTVSVPSAAGYQVAALLDAGNGQQFSIAVNGTPAATVTAAGRWDRYAATVSLPAGTDTIRLSRTGTITNDAYVKSLELLRSSDLIAYNGRVSADRADTTWFSRAKYGLMFQYGSWGYPNNVGPAKSLERQAADFDVPAFVEMVKQTGASYVIWSISWWGYHLDAPLSSPNSIVTAAGGPSNPGLTATTDLIGNVAAALHAQGIRFMLYYHTGDEDPAWWPYQQFPTSFSANGTGDRGTFFANWKTVVSEIGRRYGTSLDGFFFDDGCIYYPAPFEALEQVARTGNPSRLVSWSGSLFGGVSMTDFQDVWFGEATQGQPTIGSAPVGGNGVFTAGPNKGLLQHGMFTMDGDWGVHTQGGNKIATMSSVTSGAAVRWATDAATRNVPLSFDLMMYEDGTVADSDLAILNNVRQAVYGTTEPTPTQTSTANDTSGSITYSGTWSHSSARGAGDYSDDVHYTAGNGNSFSYTFTGTGVDVLGPKSSVSNHFDVAVDGAAIGTFSQYAATYSPQAVIYSARHLSPGSHTITLTKDDGTYLQLDALRTVPNPTTVNDTAAAFGYSGGWSYASGRGAGDNSDDVHYAAANGATATITFTGTGIDILGPMESIDGTASVSLDGTSVSTIQATYSDAYAAQQHYLGLRDLAAGSHTLTITKTGGSYLQLDAAIIWP